MCGITGFYGENIQQISKNNFEILTGLCRTEGQIFQIYCQGKEHGLATTG